MSPSLADINREIERIGRRVRWEAKGDEAAPTVALIWAVICSVFALMMPLYSHMPSWAIFCFMFSMSYTIGWGLSSTKKGGRTATPRGPDPAASLVRPHGPRPNQTLTARARAEVEETT